MADLPESASGHSKQLKYQWRGSARMHLTGLADAEDAGINDNPTTVNDTMIFRTDFLLFPFANW